MRTSRAQQSLSASPVLALIRQGLAPVFLASLLAGCATSPSVLGPNPPAVQVHPPISLAAASTTPTIITTASVRGKSDGASAGPTTLLLRRNRN
jgi:type IV pilus biogenesis protein CpaD/CtpE